MNIRNLRFDEVEEARRIFQNSIDFQKVYIAPYTDDGMIFRGGAMTWVYNDSLSKSWYYIIWWTPKIYTEGAIRENEHRTLIHELVHVWQGQYGTYPTQYWYGAAKSQGWEGLKDITKKRGFTNWNEHRGRAYAYSMNDFGIKNWDDFNYEQQASIVEDWYASGTWTNHFGDPVYGGNMSKSDPRYPFIKLNILPGSINAKYVRQKPLGKGADPIIKAIQDRLVELIYLNPKHADGYLGKNTRDAIRGFQKNNGLKVDGDIGGPNSETRKKLGIK
jgi:hypothetical protein